MIHPIQLLQSSGNLERVFLILTAILLTLNLPLILFCIAAAPVLIVMSGDSGSLMPLITLIAFVGVVGFIIIKYARQFISKHRIFLYLFLDGILIFFLITFSGNYLERVGDRLGITIIPDDIPPGILNVPKNSIPKGYHSTGHGYVYKGDYPNSKPWYSKKYTASSGSNQISYSYNLVPSRCQEFDNKEYQPGTCKVGECVFKKEERRYDQETIRVKSDGSVKTEVTHPNKLQFKYTRFAFDDHGYCVKLNFDEYDDTALLTDEEIMKVVDALERVPGHFISQDETK